MSLTQNSGISIRKSLILISQLSTYSICYYIEKHYSGIC